MKTFLILLYIYKGQLVLRQVPMKDLAECKSRGPEVIREQEKDPRFDGGLYVTCLQLKEDQAKQGN